MISDQPQQQDERALHNVHAWRVIHITMMLRSMAAVMRCGICAPCFGLHTARPAEHLSCDDSAAAGFLQGEQLHKQVMIAPAGAVSSSSSTAHLPHRAVAAAFWASIQRVSCTAVFVRVNLVSVVMVAQHSIPVHLQIYQTHCCDVWRKKHSMPTIQLRIIAGISMLL
jgi:hypothetical protein